jgi:hypothetical protein
MSDRELEAQIAGKVCLACQSVPRIVWLGALTGESAHGLRCNCWTDQRVEPTLGRPGRREETRRERMIQALKEPMFPGIADDDSMGLYPDTNQGGQRDN